MFCVTAAEDRLKMGGKRIGGGGGVEMEIGKEGGYILRVIEIVWVDVAKKIKIIHK